MCNFGENPQALALSLMPDILNLTCFIENQSAYASFSAYNAEIRACVQRWSDFMAAGPVGSAACIEAYNQWDTSMTLFHLY